MLPESKARPLRAKRCEQREPIASTAKLAYASSSQPIARKASLCDAHLISSEASLCDVREHVSTMPFGGVEVSKSIALGKRDKPKRLIRRMLTRSIVADGEEDILYSL